MTRSRTICVDWCPDDGDAIEIEFSIGPASRRGEWVEHDIEAVAARDETGERPELFEDPRLKAALPCLEEQALERLTWEHEASMDDEADTEREGAWDF